MPDSIGAPDWAYWRHALKVTAWEAVALSLNIDPAALDLRQGMTGRLLVGLPEGAEEEFARRLSLVDRDGLARQADELASRRGRVSAPLSRGRTLSEDSRLGARAAGVAPGRASFGAAPDAQNNRQ
jgi:hypothetical protein